MSTDSKSNSLATATAVPAVTGNPLQLFAKKANVRSLALRSATSYECTPSPLRTCQQFATKQIFSKRPHTRSYYPYRRIAPDRVPEPSKDAVPDSYATAMIFFEVSVCVFIVFFRIL